MMIYGVNDLSVRGRLRQFDAANGDDAIQDENGLWLLFSNGATREVNPYGALRDTTTFSPLGVARNKHYYHELKLKRAVEKFDRRKKELLADINAWGEEEQHVAELKAMRDEIRKLKAAVEEAVVDVQQHDPRFVPPAEAKQIAEAEARTEARRFKFQDRIKAIEA